jgi:hypothetical protein
MRHNLKSNPGTLSARSLTALGGAALLALGANAWCANDLDSPEPVGTLNADGSNTYNTVWLGHSDLQGRVTYQTTVHSQGDRVIAYAGHFNGTMLNPMTGVVERNGTSIVDVTDPRHPVYLKHLIADKGGARMVKLCDGSELPHGLAGHTYLLRENGPVCCVRLVAIQTVAPPGANATP